MRAPRWTIAALWLVAFPRARAQRDSTLATGITAGEADADRPKRALLKRLEWNFGFTTATLGGGGLVAYGGYDQDSLSRQQFHLASTGKLRDARILSGGRINIKRPVT